MLASLLRPYPNESIEEILLEPKEQMAYLRIRPRDNYFFVLCEKETIFPK